MEHGELTTRFTYHKPTTDQADTYTYLRGEFKKLAEEINFNCPESREKSLAMTKLEECNMWANAAIARRMED